MPKPTQKKLKRRDFLMEIERIAILSYPQDVDQALFYVTNLPSGYPGGSPAPLRLTASFPRGTAVDYCKRYFPGVELSLIVCGNNDTEEDTKPRNNVTSLANHRKELSREKS